MLYCSDWTHPIVVMVDGAASGTYPEQSCAGWSTVLSFHDWGPAKGRPSAGGIGNGDQRKRIERNLGGLLPESISV